MASGIYEEIWELLKRFDFDIDFQLNSDLLCSLCNKILINAAVGPCGCKYCHQCIANYLNGEEKFCPTQRIACKKQVISLKSDLKIDYIINRKLSLLKVKCPKTFCQFTDELKNIPFHLKSHQNKCEFSEIGCVESRNHLDNNNSLHLNLLMNTLQNLKNEMEISKGKCGKNENLINNLNMELIQMKEENNSLISQLKILATFNQNQNTINNQVNTQLNGFKNDIDVLKNSINKLDRKIINVAPYEYTIENFSNRINNVTHTYNYTDYYIPSASISECILTDEFLSDPCGYTMQLKIYPKGKGIDLNQNLTIEFGIVEGKYDDMLSWPMKRKVEIAVINQVTGEIHVSQRFHIGSVKKRFKCTFFEPSMRSEHDDHYFYGTRNLIELRELKRDKDLCKDDKIVVKCFVD